MWSQMRKKLVAIILLVGLLVLSIPGGASASPQPQDTTVISPDGWGWQNPLPQGNDLYGIWGTSSSDVYAVGEGGTILHFDGVSWAPMVSGTTNTLRGVWGTSWDDIWAVGDLGTLLHYGGTSWLPVTSTGVGLLNLIAVWGSSRYDVFVVASSGAADAGLVLHYDGSWVGMDTRVVGPLRGVSGTAANDVFVVGTAAGDQAVFYRYDGSAWGAPQDCGTAGTSGLNGVWAGYYQDMYAVGNCWYGSPYIVHQFDGASPGSWTDGSSGNLNGIWGLTSGGCSHVCAVGDGGIIYLGGGLTGYEMDFYRESSGTNENLNAVWGTSGIDIFAVGDHGTILHYEGSGNRWAVMYSGIDWSEKPAINDVWSFSPDDAWAVGSGGAILHFDGVTWTPLEGPTSADLWGVWGTDPNNVWAVGDGVILHNNGLGWAWYRDVPQMLYDISGSGWNDVPDVWAVGDDSTVWHYDGNVWATQALPSDPYGYPSRLMGVWAEHANNVWIVGTKLAGLITVGTSFHWDGSAWCEYPAVSYTGSEPELLASGLEGVWVEGSHVYAVGAYGYSSCILRWSGEGSTWVPDETGLGGNLHDVWGYDPGTWYAVGDGGTVLYGDGDSWTPMSSGTENTLRAIWGDISEIFAVGEEATIIHHGVHDWFSCSDGPRESINAVWRDDDSSEAFAVGDGGLILHYDGTRWTLMDSGISCDLNDVWGWNADDVYAVGDQGIILHYNGEAWDGGHWGGVNSQFNGVSGETIWDGPHSDASPMVFAVGDDGTGNGIIVKCVHDEWQDISEDARGQIGLWLPPYQDVVPYFDDLILVGAKGPTRGFIVTYDGALKEWAYTESGPSGTFAPLYSIRITAMNSDAYAVGQDGTILRRPGGGSAWQAMDSGTQCDLFGITSCVFGDLSNWWNELWAVGDQGIILHYDGVSWSPMDSGTGKDLREVASKAGSEDIFAVGEFGTILHYPSPTIASVSPNRGGRGQTYDVTVSGTRFVPDQTTISFGPGIAINTCTVDSETQITASITVAADAIPGPRNILVSTPEGTTTVANGFTVFPPPAITSVSRNIGSMGQTLDVTITGTGFYGPRTVAFGPGITVTYPATWEVFSTTSIKVRLSISSSNVAPGPRAVSISTPYGLSTLANGFTLTREPVITSVSPRVGGPGQTVDITITGGGFYFPRSVSFTPSSGMSVTYPAELFKWSLNTMSFRLSISADAPLGPRSMTIHSYYGSYTLPSAFEVVQTTSRPFVRQIWATRSYSLVSAMPLSGSASVGGAALGTTSNVSTNVDDFAGAMALDGSGNIYVTGMSEGTLIMGPGLEGGDYRTTKYLSTDNYAGVVSWSRTYNGCLVSDNIGGIDWAQAIAVDSSGNVYVTGGSEGEGANGMDYATVKYDSQGNQAWVARYNGPASGYDQALAIAVDSSGNIYVTGESFGTDQGYDYATVKYNSSGVEQWVARYDESAATNDSDVATAIAVDGQGNVYVTGRSLGALIYIDYADYATVKYDANGVQRWVATYDGAGGSDIAEAIALDGQGNVYVCGSSDGATGDWDYAVVKYKDNGDTADQVWVARYNGPVSGMDSANDMAIDASGNIYVTGYSQDEVTGFDYATVKFEDHGTYASEAWVARYDGPVSGDDWASALALDGGGNVYVTGESPNGVSSDYATVKYDSSGKEVWVARYDGPAGGLDSATDIVVDGRGNVFVTGTSAGGSTGWDWATVMYSQGVKTYTWLGLSPIIRFPSATLQFEEVTLAGETEVITSPTGPTLPSSYKSGDPSTYFEISTTAEYTGPVEVSLSYAGMTFDAPEGELRLLHQTETGWEDITTGVNQDDKLVSGFTTSFSTFVIVTQNRPPVVGSISAPIEPIPVNRGMNASASFFDPDPSDYGLHTAVWDWGDDTSSAGLATEANGSGTVTGSHTYSAAGIYTIKLTVTDNHGLTGTSALTIQVIQKYAMWANASDGKAIQWSGSGAQITGSVHSNGGISMSGSNNAVNGTVYYVSKFAITGSSDHCTLSQQLPSVRPMPVHYDLSAYQPGGTAAQAAGKYQYVNGNFSVSKSGMVLDGLYYVKGNVNLSGSNIRGTFTIVAEGTISISGSGLNCTAYSGDLLFFSNGTSLSISGSNSTLGGIIYVPKGQINISGSGSKISGSLFGDRIALSGSNTKITVR